jgi:flagellar basal-body rod protein FlgG
LGNPAQAGFGSLLQNHLETSNVNVAEEMVNMILAQRAYEVNAKAIQSSDQMMEQANNIKR